MKETKLLNKEDIKDIKEMLNKEEKSLIITTLDGFKLMCGEPEEILAQICDMLHTLYNDKDLGMDKDKVLKTFEEVVFVTDEEAERKFKEKVDDVEDLLEVLKEIKDILGA